MLDYFDKNWSDFLQLDQEGVSLSTESFSDNMNSILGEHVPLKRINKYTYKLKFKSKPLIIPAIQKSIIVKTNLLKRFINEKDLQAKETFHMQYKHYRHILSVLFKEKQKLLQSIFQSQ